MKKYSYLVICLLLSIVFFAQSTSMINYAHYYYNREKVKLPINKQKFTIYFDLNKISKNNIQKTYKILKEVTLASPKSNSMYCCEIFIANTNYDSILNVLMEVPEILDIEPVLGDNETILVSNVFYVQLKDVNKYETMLAIADATNTKFISEIPYCKNWFAFECNKSSVSNAIGVSNIFYESGVFSNVDPGFIYEISTNCVTDSNFISDQWNMQRINACSAWNITTGNPNVKVAVIDQGIDEHHNEFKYVNKYISYDVRLSSHMYTINGNHGTHVGGIIFANHNKYQIAGVAPNTSMINICHSLTGLDEMFIADMAKGINFAWINNADIINNSWGIKKSIGLNLVNSPLLESAIQEALTLGRNGMGCVVVFAAGNTKNDYDMTLDIIYPACCNDSILVVGAINKTNYRVFFSKYGTELDVVAPGYGIYSSVFDNGFGGIYDYSNGTSMAAPHVAGVAALILSVNPNLTGQQVRDIIESTAQKVGNYNYTITSDHPNGTWNNEMGYGLVDAYAAVLKAMDAKIDLYVRDDIYDDGTEPNVETALWYGPDIWLEDSLGRKVERPANNTEYNVCVRIHNRSEYVSNGNEKLFLNWSKAGLNNLWDEGWTNKVHLPCGVAQGGSIGNPNGIIIPSIPAGDNRIIKVTWLTPNGGDYTNCTDFHGDPWHFCLLARIHDSDTIAHENEKQASVYDMVKNHNNVAQINIYFINSTQARTVVKIGNSFENIHVVNLEAITEENSQGENITDYADIELTFNEDIFSTIQINDMHGITWVERDDNFYTLKITDLNNFKLPLHLEAEQHGTILTNVHFHADAIPQDTVMEFDIVFTGVEGEFMGGEHYKCIRSNDRYFQAIIQGNLNIYNGENTTLYANDIGEGADYIWYDAQGSIIGYGPQISVNPTQTTTYSLSITAHSDGYRAIGSARVEVSSLLATLSISPNPAKNMVTIEYRLPENEEQIILQMLNPQGKKLYNKSTNNNKNAVSKQVINTSNFAAGQYKVQLLNKKGNILESKTLIIE